MTLKPAARPAKTPVANAVREVLTEEEARALLANLHTLTLQEQYALLDDLERFEKVRTTQACKDDFLFFCKHVYPEWKEGPHHRFLKPILHDVVEGTEDRLTVSMPPRFGKSETIAYLFVAWYLGHHPEHYVIMVTHTANLSASFGRKVRDLIESPVYQEIFPGTRISKDKTASDDWVTTKGGKYLAIGVGGSVAGYGAHLLIADDLVSEQAVLANPDTAFESAWNYMQVGPLQRLMPGGRIIMIGTRWGKKDPIGRALNWALDDPHQKKWHEIRFPAILPSGKSLWPEQWPVDQLLAKKASMQPQFWAAQYVQEPTSEEGALLKRGWWRIWTDPRPPQVEFIIQSWDTAHETKTTNDYSACITWGVWFNEETNRRELIMLDAFKDRWEFPQLKEKAFKAYKQWEPEALIIEKKASGAPLIQEMRQMDIVVEEFSPSRGRGGVSNDKRARVNSVAPILMDGICWIPDRKWATDVVEECAEFPNGEFDDYVDAVTLALMRYRLGGFVILSTDRKEVEIVRAPRRRAYY